MSWTTARLIAKLGRRETFDQAVDDLARLGEAVVPDLIREVERNQQSGRSAFEPGRLWRSTGAIRALGRIGSRSAVATVHAAFTGHGFPDSVLCEAAEALGELGGLSAARTLLSAGDRGHRSADIQNAARDAFRRLAEREPSVVLDLWRELAVQDEDQAGAVIKRLQGMEASQVPFALTALREPDEPARCFGARLLTAIDHSSARSDVESALRKAWRDPSPTVRAYALVASVPYLEEGDRAELESDIDDPSSSVRQAAVTALVRLGTAAGPDRLEEMLTDPVSRVRRHALIVLAKSDPERAIPHLITALVDDDEPTRSFALELLTELGGDAVPALMVAAHGDEATIRDAARKALSGQPRASAPALPTLLDDSVVGDYAWQSLEEAHLDHGDDADPVAEALMSDQEVPTGLASHAMRSAPEVFLAIDHATTVGYLTHALQDADRTAWAAAAGVIAHGGFDELLPAVLELLDDMEPAFRAAIESALRDHGNLVEQLLRLSDGPQSAQVHRALVAVGYPAVAPILDVIAVGRGDDSWAQEQLCAVVVEIARANPELVRHRVVEALRLKPTYIPLITMLGAIPGSEGIDVLRLALASPIPHDRACAAWALGQTHSPSAIPLLIPLLSDELSYVCGAAEKALDEIGGSATADAMAEILLGYSRWGGPFPSQSRQRMYHSAADIMLRIDPSRTEVLRGLWELGLYG